MAHSGRGASDADARTADSFRHGGNRSGRGGGLSSHLADAIREALRDLDL